MLENIQFLAIEGVIGVGKTCLAEILSKMFSTGKILEQHEGNPFLDGFYRDREKHAFQTQIWFLLSRYQQIMEHTRQRDLFHRTVISDFMFEKDRLFAHITLNENELLLYNKIADTLERDVVKPDFVVYLQASTDVLVERISQRGRPFERNMNPQFIDDLNEAYNHFFFHYEDSPVLIINTNCIDFVQNVEELDEIVAQIGKHQRTRGVTYYHPLDKAGLIEVSKHEFEKRKNA